MSTRQKLPAIFAGTALLAAASGFAFAQATSAASGTWQQHKYSFVAMGFTSTYSCDGLADKLKVLLLAAGARADAKVQAGPCPSGFGQPEKLARADLVFYTLAPATPDKPAESPAVVGAWQPVALTQKSPRELGLGDCELVEQFRAQLLPMFATRAVEDRTTCVPNQESGSVINLKFETFTAPPAVKTPRAAS